MAIQSSQERVAEWKREIDKTNPVQFNLLAHGYLKSVNFIRD